MTCLSWLALHGMVHSFIELDKPVVHVIIGYFSVIVISVCVASDALCLFLPSYCDFSDLERGGISSWLLSA